MSYWVIKFNNNSDGERYKNFICNMPDGYVFMNTLLHMKNDIWIIWREDDNIIEKLYNLYNQKNTEINLGIKSIQKTNIIYQLEFPEEIVLQEEKYNLMLDDIFYKYL